MTTKPVDFAAELTHLADCPTCGRPRWAITKCRCSHDVVGHDLGTLRGVTVRTKCLVGGCGCAKFAEAVTANA